MANTDDNELNISKTFLPRRADTATMSTYKAGIVLSKGELFLEYPNSGPGTKGNYFIKIGDGVTPYKDLPYAFGMINENFIAFKDITINNTDLKSFEEYMDEIKSGVSFGDIMTYLKAAIHILNNEHNEHVEDESIHVSKEDRESWTTVGTPIKARGSLNDLKTPGTRYYADSGNNCTDKPSNDKVDAFGMEVFLTATGHVCQELTEDNISPGRKWVRIFNGTSWSKWVQLYSSDYPPGTVDVSIKSQQDILEQRIDTTYLKNISQNKTQEYQNLSHSDRYRQVEHIFTITKGNETESTFNFEDENTQYQMHVKNSSNNDGNVILELTSTDSTSNDINIKGDGKGTKVESVNDVVDVKTDYDISIEPHKMSDNTYNGVDIVLTDINGNRKIVTLRSIDETRVTAVNGNEINFYIPNVAIERLVKVTDKQAMFTLTRNDIQNGDTVLDTSTSIMYFVVDDQNLDNDNGYAAYTSHKATELTNPRKIDGVEFRGDADIYHFGTCSTPAGTAAKVVACNNFKLVTGARISVEFTATDTAGNCTLNVNGTGAKSIKVGSENIRAMQLQANYIYEFIYTGSVYKVNMARCLFFDGGEDK